MELHRLLSFFYGKPNTLLSNEANVIDRKLVQRHNSENVKKTRKHQKTVDYFSLY